MAAKFDVPPGTDQKSDGAFYTNDISALMLARLAFTRDFVDWSDPEAVAKLRIIDPACGSGALLMATLQTIKDRVAEVGGDDGEPLHKRIVEDVICGLDINQDAVQAAARNLARGAPTVDKSRMNLATMPHGIQADGQPKAGALEILMTADDTQSQSDLFDEPRSSPKGRGATGQG